MMSISNHKYCVDLIIAGIIIVLPFIQYGHLFFEENYHVISNFIDFEHEIDGTFVWHFLLRLIPTSLFCLWFITSDYPWRYLIYIPIILFTDSLIRVSLLPIFGTRNEALLLSIIANTVLVFGLYFIRAGWNYHNVNSTKITFIKLLTNDAKTKYEALANLISTIKNRNQFRTHEKYLKELLYAKSIIKSEIGYLNKWNFRKFRPGTLWFIILIFIALPFLFNIHTIIPQDSQSIQLGIITISNNGFQSVDIMIWLLLLKVTYLICLSIWFISTPNWWKYAILSPIILVSYQIWEMFQDVRHIDAWGNLRALPFIMFVLLTLVIISNSIKYEFKVSNLHRTITQELEHLISYRAQQDKIAEFKHKLNTIKSAEIKGKGLEKNELKALIELREALMKDLEVD